MDTFLNTPVFNSKNKAKSEYLIEADLSTTDVSIIVEHLKANRIVLIQAMDFSDASQFFRNLAEYCNLSNSYKTQMDYVIRTMEDRKSVDKKAVTVNSRSPYELIQPHCEGDSTAQLDLFSLYCETNSNSGGESIFSLINQKAEFSHLRAKEKIVVGNNLSEADLIKLRGYHFDARELDSKLLPTDKIVVAKEKGYVVVRNKELRPSTSVLTGKSTFTLWDNVTVHDHAFHKYFFSLVKELGILNESLGKDYRSYLHIEEDSYWAPADTLSGTAEQTSNLFKCHVVLKLAKGDFILVNNRTWTHAANNWNHKEPREIFAMYA